MDQCKRVLFGFALVVLVCPCCVADTWDQIESQEVVIPVLWSDVEGLEELAEGEVIPNDSLLHNGNSVFSFLPQMSFVPGTDNFVIVTWSQEGGWQGPSRAAVWKYDGQGNLLAGPTSVQDDGEESSGHGFAWDVGVFSDGSLVAAGPTRFVLADEEGVYFQGTDYPICSTRHFDADLNRTGVLHSTFEPTLVCGNDDRDADKNLKPRIAVLSNDRYVVSALMASAKMQEAVGLTDTGATPVEKAYYRVFEKDGTPVGPTQLAFRVGNPDEEWSFSTGSHDITARPGGGFAMVASGTPKSANGGSNAIQFFDNDGNTEGELFSVVDQDLVDNGAENQEISPEISQSNGIYALGSCVLVFGMKNFALTLFDDNKNIIRSTINGIGQQDMAPIRESDVGQDSEGNVLMVTRGQFPEGPDLDSDMVVMRLITKEGEYLADSFTPVPESDFQGSQRDPVVIANENIMVCAYLNEHVGGSVGDTAIRIFNNPFPQTTVGDWSLF